MLSSRRKKGPSFFLIVKLAVFLETCFYHPLRSYRIDLITCTLIVTNNCRHLYVVPWGFLILDSMRENWQIKFISERLAFSSETCVFNFSTTFFCYRKDLITCTITVKLSHGDRYFVPWDLSFSIIRGKKGQNFFFTGTIALFWKLVSNGLLRIIKTTSYLAEKLPKYLGKPNKKLLGTCHARQNEKKLPKKFSSYQS